MRPTVEILRDDIDKGRAQDKVRHQDPAAVPLGADEEAAGTPPSDGSIQLAHRNEVSGPAKSTEDGGAPLYLAIVAIVIVVLGGAAAALLSAA
jgi:hypothetical protein